MSDGSTPAPAATTISQVIERLGHERKAKKIAAGSGIAAEADELRHIEGKLTTATNALLHTRRHMIDEEDDAYSSLNLIEDALIEAGEMLGKVLAAIDPKGTEGVVSHSAQQRE